MFIDVSKISIDKIKKKDTKIIKFKKKTKFKICCHQKLLFLLCLINFSFCVYGNVSYFTQAKTFGFCIFDSNIFLHTANNYHIGNQTRLNAEKTAQTLSYDRKSGRLVGVLYFGANSVESDSRLDRITPPIQRISKTNSSPYVI